MSRFARTRKVVFLEEPMPAETGGARMELRACPDTGVLVATPRLDDGAGSAAHRAMVDALISDHRLAQGIAWYYTPMALQWSSPVRYAAIVYDCMDELSSFRFAPTGLAAAEDRLLSVANVVFTGGQSLYEAKRNRHGFVHCFPSGVDLPHFATAQRPLPDPADQAGLGRPRLGYFGVIDERIDFTLLAHLAAERPHWQIVMVGPLAKVTSADLPQVPNLHWLGGKPYAELPAYLANWNVALMPFALNETRRFVSPTKAPEYLAGGRTVVSTAIRDVRRRFADVAAVRIAEDAPGFVAACDAALIGGRVLQDDVLSGMLEGMGWDGICAAMQRHIAVAMAADRLPGHTPARPVRPVPGLRSPKAAFDTLVVGAGFAGSVLAERLASEAGQKVLVIDRRPHVAGNAFDEHDAAGLLVHRYGPHIFHTNSDAVFDYLSRFTEWRPYEHRVLASVSGKLVPMPINRTTLNMLYGTALEDDAAAAAFLADRAEPVAEIRSAEDFVVAAVGRDLYETFFRGYTLKQWGVDPSMLDKSVTARVPTRTGTDDRYFVDKHQQMPRHGYTRMFENMLDHDNITVQLGCDWRDLGAEVRWKHMVFTGPIDAFYDQRFGPLPYRSLRFEHRTLDESRHQQVGTVNYPSAAIPFTRITEFKHLTGQVHRQTSICHEYPMDEGDPYYPVPAEANAALFKRYQALADNEPAVSFLGRLGSYRYFNMDQVVAQSLAAFRRMELPPIERRTRTFATVRTAVPAGEQAG